ncbi:hypothetical protein GW17_00062390 [Ensete ventricosum]|nr:hypothetical protein GW17_00062390 [Ensete ventricosum]RZR77344.1 hypothetical protein BHM03_00002385 [Ensete ventricosum]
MVLLAELTRLPALVAGVDFCNALPLPALAAASPLPTVAGRCLLFLPLLLAPSSPTFVTLSRASTTPSLRCCRLRNLFGNAASDRSEVPLLPAVAVASSRAASSPSSSRDRSPPLQHHRCTLLQPSSSDPFSRRLFLFKGSSKKTLSTPEQRDPLVLLQ